MSILLEQLASIDPGIASEHCAGFRTCLVAIAQRIQTEPEYSMLSLNDWLQWLDDEGYEREGFAAILQQICEQELGDQASTDLWSHGRSIAAAADGIPNLITHVHSVHPGLEQRMTELEALALEEESQIQHTAGGITRAGKIALYSVAGAVVVGGGIGIGVGVRNHLRRRAQRLEHQVHEGIQERQERATEHLANAAETEEKRLDRETNSWLKKSGIAKDLNRKYILEHDSIPLDFRLSDLNETQVELCACALKEQLKVVHMETGVDELSKLGSEISTRLLKFAHPDLYVHAFKEWAEESSKDLGEKILSPDLRPNDISMDLRHEFEGSDLAAKFMTNLRTTEDDVLRKAIRSAGFRDTGFQHIIGNNHTVAYYRDLLLLQRDCIKKAKNEGALSSEMEWLDTNLKYDFSDETVRKMLNEIGDQVFQNAIGREAKISELFSKISGNKINFQEFAKCREAEEIIAKYGQGVESAEIKSLRRALKDLRRSDSHAKLDFGDYLRSIYIEERKSLDSLIKNSLEKDVKTRLVDELEKMDDISDWLAKRDLKKDFEIYLEADATKAFRDALSAAKELIKESAIDAEKAAVETVEIL